jgi:hypothetical protein
MQPPRSTRELFAHVLQREVAILQAQFPLLSHGISRACAILVAGRVFPEDDGRSAMVQSSDGQQWYHVNGLCPCKASAYRHESCKHRLAFRLYQRVAAALLVDDEARWEPTDDTPAFTAPATAPTIPAEHLTTIQGRTFTDIGDASPENVARHLKPAFVRMAATRASARALRRALNVAACAVE